MEYKIDVQKMITSLKKAEVNEGIGNFIETEGEQYIFDNIFTKLLNGQNLKISDIDFDAFDEDDIVTIIDDKLRGMESILMGVERIAEHFIKTPPKTVMSREFF